MTEIVGRFDLNKADIEQYGIEVEQWQTGSRRRRGPRLLVLESQISARSYRPRARAPLLCSHSMISRSSSIGVRSLTTRV